MSGANTFNDQLTVQANTRLIASSAAALGGASYWLIVNNGGTLSLNLNGTYNSRSVQIAGSGVLSGGVGVGALENLSGNNTRTGTVQLNAPSTIGVTAGSLTLGSAVTGNYPLTKIGAGTLTLNAANTYNGGTFVNAGTLLVNGSLPVGNAVTVAGGATLGGYGTINGPVDLQAGSALRPGAAGNSIGTLTIASTLALSGTTATTMEINGNLGDSVVSMSTITYGGTLTVNNLGTDPAPGTKFTLFNAAARSGSFGSVTLPTLTLPNRAWVNNLATDGSIQVAYTGQHDGAEPHERGGWRQPQPELAEREQRLEADRADQSPGHRHQHQPLGLGPRPGLARHQRDELADRSGQADHVLPLGFPLSKQRGFAEPHKG